MSGMVRSEVIVNDMLTGKTERIEFEYDPARETQTQAAGRLSAARIAQWHGEYAEALAAKQAAQQAAKQARSTQRRKEMRERGE